MAPLPRGRSHHQALLRQAARRDLDAPRLAPNDDLRAWDQLLAGGGPSSTIDELPEVALPQRLAARLPKTPSLDHLGELADLDGVVQLERAAARKGMTSRSGSLAACSTSPRSHEAYG